MTTCALVKVPDWTKDNAAGRLILQHHGLEVFESPLHLEGGSIHTDGEGYVFLASISAIDCQPVATVPPCLVLQFLVVSGLALA